MGVESIPVHQRFLRRIFPRISEEMIKKTTEVFYRPVLEARKTGLFLRGDIPLKASGAWLNAKIPLLLTEEERFRKIAEKSEEFAPIEVLESRSERARICLVEEREKVAIWEFKGLTPKRVNPGRLHPSSGQPYWVFANGPAEKEKMGITLVGAIEARVIELGSYFEDLVGYAQLLRRAKPGEFFFPWLRMDIQPSIYQVLAELEEIPFETFLCQAGERMGQELGSLHRKRLTLHEPFLDEEDPFFSSLHSGNVEVHGHLLDLEGLNKIEEAEEQFWWGVKAYAQRLSARKIMGYDPLEGWKVFGKVLKFEQNPFSLFSRSCDLQRFLGGTAIQWGMEPSFFRYWQNQPEDYLQFLSSFFLGYYPEIREQRKEEEVKAYLKEVVKVLEERKKEYWLFPYTYQIMEEVEEELRVSI